MRLVLVVATLCLASTADGKTIVLESYAGERPANTERLLAPLHTELSALGYLSGPAELGSTIESGMSRSAGTLDQEQLGRA